MAIILFTSERGGFGDFSLMITIAKKLKSSLEIIPEIILVVDNHVIKGQILARFEMGELGLLTKHEYEASVRDIGNKQLIPTLVIEGPTYQSGRRLFVDQSVPVLFIAEYSANEQATLCDTFNIMKTRRRIDGNQTISVDAGFLTLKRIGSNLANIEMNLLRNPEKEMGFSKEFATQHYSGNKEKGIVIREELFKAGNQRRANPSEFKKNKIKELPPQILTLLCSSSITPENYLNDTSFYLIYTHDSGALEHFIKVVTDIQKDQPKRNCDILVVGSLEELKLSELSDSLKISLKNTSFSQGEIVLADKKIPLLSAQSKSTSENKLRILHLPFVKNSDLIDLMLISENITGVTGDQSFSECIALGNLPVYSCHSHKETFYNGLIKFAQEQQLPALASYLKRTAYYISEENKDLSSEVNMPPVELVYKELMQLRDYVYENMNFLNLTVETIRKIFQEPAPGFRKDCLDKIQACILHLAGQNNDNLDKLSYLGMITAHLQNGLSIVEARLKANSEYPEFAKPNEPSFYGNKLNIFSDLQIAIQAESESAKKSEMFTVGKVSNLFALKQISPK